MIGNPEFSDRGSPIQVPDPCLPVPRKSFLFAAILVVAFDQLLVCGLRAIKISRMPFLIVFFTLALSLCVLGLVIISLWWSWLFLAAILQNVRSGRKLKKPNENRSARRPLIYRPEPSLPSS